jgi:flavorubredoxin
MIIDNVEPKQQLSCDLCGGLFNRTVKSEHDLSFGMWKDVSIAIYPNVGNNSDLISGKGYIMIDHACEDCRKKFLTEIRSLIGKLKIIA